MAKSKCLAGFTLIELLVVLAILAILAAILFAVFGRVREKGRQAACASNLHQLGLAIAQYTQDYDERHPVSSETVPSTQQVVLHCTAWAGSIYPDVKNVDTFECPDDPTRAALSPARYPVSYAINSNLASGSANSSLTAPASTVLLFEDMGVQAAITTPGENAANVSTPQVSAAGNGLNGALTNLVSPTADLDGASYATGRMDNAVDASVIAFDQYAASSGRHSGGSNFLAADGHTTWLPGSRVSAGANALSPGNPQSSTGCRFSGYGEPGGFPCAEGASLGAHAMTFSVR